MKSLICNEDGAEVVEFALAATVLFTLVFGIIEFCLGMYADNFVAFAAQHGTRYAMVRGSDWTSACASASSYGCQATAANVQNDILGLPHPGLNLTASNITVTWPGTTASGSSTGCTANAAAQGCLVKVKISYPFALHIPFYSGSIPLGSTSEETIQD
ncbi:MAG: TadE/TadG family type IV pilus assembly protein [Terracidiphilus sp.]|jgi:Flp pilus assembly protein TadG